MFRLSKKIEYAILALQYIAGKQSELVTAKEISEKLGIPYEFLSKALQTLMKKGIVESWQGTKGGYLLSKGAEDISVGEVIRALEDNPVIVECISNHSDEQCERMDICTIKNPMAKIQHQINSIFEKTSIAQLADSRLIDTKELL